MIILGWIGSILLALCGAPIAYDAWKTKKSNINGAFLLTWFAGEVLTLIYTIYKEEDALTFNYFSNIIFILVVMRYRFTWKFGKK